MKRKEFALKKIYLEDFINVLIDIYERGADYVDLIGYPNSERDRIDLIVTEEYMRKDEEEENKGLTMDKLNDLLDG